MTYVERINTELVIPKKFEFNAIDLFAGCGGLSLGFEACGVRTTGYEMEPDYVATYQGLRPLVITTFKNVVVAETMAENAGVAGRVEFFDVEQFVASNILELSKFSASGRKVTVQDLIARYNRVAGCENNPGLLVKGA